MAGFCCLTLLAFIGAIPIIEQCRTWINIGGSLGCKPRRSQS